MPEPYEKLKRSALKSIAEKLCVSARTAPKTKGIDNLVINILTDSEKNELADRMREKAKRTSRPGFQRDAANIDTSDTIILIGTKSSPSGLDCGFCGYPDCASLTRGRGFCAYSAIDLGIALGSAAFMASLFHADNRLMYSVGKTALEWGILPGCVMAIGIPLSASGKNPFFDR